MNDVLPKPFTKEGLLNMLEKYLDHLKKVPEGLEMGPATASTMAESTGGHSLKEESSPGESPSTMSTWHSPGQFTGMSPTTPGGHFMPQPAHPQSGYTIDSNGIQFQQPHTPLGAPPRVLNHRRQLSEMAGIDDTGGSDLKRPRIYPVANAATNMMRRGPSG